MVFGLPPCWEVHNHALKSTDANLWENNSYPETHLKIKLGAEKECPLGPHDGFTCPPSLYSSPVFSHSPTSLPANFIKACCAGISFLCFTSYQDNPINVIFHTFSFPVFCISMKFHLPDSLLSVSHLKSHSLVISNKVQKEEVTKGQRQTKVLLPPITQTLSKSYMGIAQSTKTEYQHLQKRRLVLAHNTSHSTALLP